MDLVPPNRCKKSTEDISLVDLVALDRCKKSDSVSLDRCKKSAAPTRPELSRDEAIAKVREAIAMYTDGMPDDWMTLH